MKHRIIFLMLGVLLAAGARSTVIAEETAGASPMEARLRDALRGTTLQLREAQTQVVNLQAAQAQLEQDKTVLKTQVDGLNKQVDQLIAAGKENKAASEKTIAALNGKLEEQGKRIDKLQEVLEKWKSAYNEAVTLAKAKEMERAKLEMDNALLQRSVADREAKNIELFKIGNEILTRYEKFSLGDALGAKEPFTGTMRVKLQNLVQDYEDKLAAQRINDTDPKPTESKQNP